MLEQEYIDDEGGLQPIILVLDDDKELLEIASFVLEEEFSKYGYEVVQAAGEKEVFDCLQTKGRPSLMLVDLDMLDTSSEELLLDLKNDPSTSMIPVVAFSADQDMNGEFDLSSISEYLVKPLDSESLVSSAWRSIDRSMRMSEHGGMFGGAWDYTPL